MTMASSYQNASKVSTTPFSNMRTLNRLLRLLPMRNNPWEPVTGKTKVNLDTFSRGSTNLEIFKFGMYIMFPVSFMYYFGTNLDKRFSVPGFWPEAGTTNKIPYERKEQQLLLEVMKHERLERKRKRLESELGGKEEDDSETGSQEERAHQETSPARMRVLDGQSKEGSNLGVVDKWAQGNQ